MNRQILKGLLLLCAVTLLSSLSFAHTTAAGCDDGKTAVTISDENNWATLCKQTVDLSDGAHNCVADGSATVSNTVGDIHNKYRFTLATKKNPKTDLAGEQQIDVNQDLNATDLAKQPVSAVHFFNLNKGSYTFYWLARPFDSAADDVDVTRFSMGVVCTDAP